MDQTWIQNGKLKVNRVDITEIKEVNKVLPELTSLVN